MKRKFESFTNNCESETAHLTPPPHQQDTATSNQDPQSNTVLPPELIDHIGSKLRGDDLFNMRRGCRFFYSSLEDQTSKYIHEKDYVQIAMEHNRLFILRADGRVLVSGRHKRGALGLGDDISATDINGYPVLILGLEDISKIYAGTEATLFLKKNGTLWGCGNLYDLMGAIDENGSDEEEVTGETNTYTKPIPIPGLRSIKEIFFCNQNDHLGLIFLKDDGTVWSCGYSDEASLGFSEALVPLTKISSLPNVKKFFSTHGINFILTHEGTLSFSHSHSYLENNDRFPWFKYHGISGIKDIICSFGTLYFWNNQDKVMACSTNFFKDLLSNNSTDFSPPIELPNLEITQWAQNEGSTFVLTKEGSVLSVGVNDEGELGLGHKKKMSELTVIPNFSDVTKIYAVYDAVFFKKKDGTHWACGNNFQGSLGVGDEDEHLTPTLVKHITDIEAIQKLSSTLFLKGNHIWISGRNLRDINEKSSIPRIMALNKWNQFESVFNIGAPPEANHSLSLSIPEVSYKDFLSHDTQETGSETKGDEHDDDARPSKFL